MNELYEKMAQATLDRIEKEGENITLETIDMVMQVGYMLSRYCNTHNQPIPPAVKNLVRWLVAYAASRFQEESEQEHGLSKTTTELLLQLRTNFARFLPW